MRPAAGLLPDSPSAHGPFQGAARLLLASLGLGVPLRHDRLLAIENAFPASVLVAAANIRRDNRRISGGDALRKLERDSDLTFRHYRTRPASTTTAPRNHFVSLLIGPPT